MTHDDLVDQWQHALDRYSEIDTPIAKFNVVLISALRPDWEHRVRIATSMFRLVFVSPGTTSWPFDEHVDVEYENDLRVSVSLVRVVPRRGDPRPVGPVVVAGDIVRPENAIPVVESFLVQIASQGP